MRFLRPASVLALASIALAAKAGLLHVESEGRRFQGGRSDVTGSEAVKAQTGGLGLTSMSVSYSSGLYTYTRSSFLDALTLYFEYSKTSSLPSDAIGGVLRGTWFVFTPTCQGAFAGYTGSGTFETLVEDLGPFGTGNEIYLCRTTIDGNVQAVPEPATMAALGLGAVAVLRRRKRA